MVWNLDGVSLSLTSSSNEFSWCCKFADGLSMITYLQKIVLEIRWGFRITDAEPSSNFKQVHTTRWGMSFLSAKMGYHKNSFVELAKCGETPPWQMRFYSFPWDQAMKMNIQAIVSTKDKKTQHCKSKTTTSGSREIHRPTPVCIWTTNSPSKTQSSTKPTPPWEKTAEHLATWAGKPSHFTTKAWVRPHLETSNAIWFPTKKQDIELKESVQRRATR